MKTGAEALMQTAVRAGAELCVANPGTTELSLVTALDSVPGIRAVLALFEGVCTGAADGYGRMARKPALTLTHLGPGFANGIANLHNARRARTPIVNLIGDHATWHAAADAPLASDIESLARPVSGWLRRGADAGGLAGDVAEAIAAARSGGGRVATLIVPSDCAGEQAQGAAVTKEPEPPVTVESARVEEIAALVRGDEPWALLLGGAGALDPALANAGRIAAATSCELWADFLTPRMQRGAGHPGLMRLPYFPEHCLDTLRRYAHLVIAGTRLPVSFFGYPGQPSHPVPEGCRVHHLATADEDVVGAISALAEALGASGGPVAGAELGIPERPTGALDPRTLGPAIAALQPEGVIVMDEGGTSTLPYALESRSCAPFDYLCHVGGAIGQGLPVATGAALACPDRTVIAIQADGSAAYTVQSLWTQAREGLDVKTIICANRAYRILEIELKRAGVAEPGPKTRAFADLTGPELDWVALARGFGVPGARATTAAEMVRELERALAASGPYLIEALV